MGTVQIPDIEPLLPELVETVVSPLFEQDTNLYMEFLEGEGEPIDLPADKINAELERLKALSPEFQEQAKAIEELQKDHAQLARDATETLLKLNALSDTVQEDLLTMDTLKQDLANVPTVLAVITDNLGYTTDNGRGCEMVGRAKIENGKVSPLPDEKPISAMGDSAIFRMLETYVNFSIDLKMRIAKDPKVAPSIREEIEARPGSVASCPQVVDEILVSQADAEAAKLRDASLEAFKDQTDRPMEWFKAQAEKQKLVDHPAGLQSEKAPGKA